MEEPKISDLKLSRLMLGTVQFGLPYGIGIANRSGQPSYETARSIIAAAYEGGVDLRTVQSILGHQTYQMTLRYAHLSPEHQRQAVDILAGKTVKLIRDAALAQR